METIKYLVIGKETGLYVVGTESRMYCSKKRSKYVCCPDAFKCTCYSFKLFCAVGSDINFVTFRIEFLERALYQIEILVIKRLTTCMKRNGSCMFSRFCILRNATFYNHVFTRQSQKGFSHYVILWFVFGHRIFVFVNFCSVKSKITCKINCIVREKICHGNCFVRR